MKKFKVTFEDGSWNIYLHNNKNNLLNELTEYGVCVIDIEEM